MSRNALQNLVMHKWMKCGKYLFKKLAAHPILTRMKSEIIDFQMLDDSLVV